MVEVDWAGTALDDLHCIHGYIQRDSPRYAQVMVERITAATHRLSSFPDSGTVLPEFPQATYRQVLVGSYRVVYRFDAAQDRVLILAIVHASRDFLSIMDD
ncbi:MAG: type II toxin-antitoxin system RelE/ParE family toxin [Pirellulaceae bacterium]